MTCAAPRCGRPGRPFCEVHAAAPAGQRGGWLSARRRQIEMAPVAMPVSMPTTVPLDASNIVRRIWVGSAPPMDRRLPHFSMVVLCAAEIQPQATTWGCRVVRVGIPDDALSRPELRRAVLGARAVVDEVQHGGRALVTCAAGRNRSALVAGIAIIQLAPRMTADDVVELIRGRRSPDCLSNPHFREILRRLRAPPPPAPPDQAR